MWRGHDRSEPGPFPNRAAGQTQSKFKVGFILARSFTLSAFSLFVDTLRLAGDELDRSRRLRADWEVLANTRHLIRSSCGVSVAPTSDLVAPQRFDIIVVVGGLIGTDQSCDAEALAYLKQAAKSRVPLIGLCTGTFMLAEAGLMGAHHNCVSWLHVDDFRDRFPHLRVRADRLFNFDGRRGSCAGGSSAADLAAFLVRSRIGPAAAQNALDVLQINHARHFTDAQARLPIRQLTGDGTIDNRVNAVLLTMEQNLVAPKTIEQLAASVSVSRRQLERLFRTILGMSPARAYSELRLRRAHYLLINTDRRIVDIAVDVGFDNASHFSRAFRKIHGRSPTALRIDGETVPSV